MGELHDKMSADLTIGGYGLSWLEERLTVNQDRAEALAARDLPHRADLAIDQLVAEPLDAQVRGRYVA